MSVKNKTIDQVPLFQLLFTLNWEDPKLDIKALKINPNDTVFAITSGGCNILEFLLHDPSVVYSVDINPTQTYLMELKIQAIKQLGYEDFMQLFGMKESTQRAALYNKIKNKLSKEAQSYWQQQHDIISKGVFFNGRFERFVNLAGKSIRFLQGKNKTKTLFEIKDQKTQVEFFDKTWNTRRMRLIFDIMFNKRSLAKKGLSADYFHFDDGSKSFAENFFNRYKKVVRDLPVSDNYFLSLYIQGKYNSQTAIPECYKKEHYQTLKNRVDRIQLHTMGAQQWFSSMPDQSIDCFALSNICELMSLADTELLFKEIYRTSKPNARVIFRNLIVPREVPETLQRQIVKDAALSAELINNDRSFVYSKVNAYNITHV